MREPDGYAIVKLAYVQSLIEQKAEFPDLEPGAPSWDNLGSALRDAIARVFYHGGSSAIEAYTERLKETYGPKGNIH